jgi:CubicO group peptidase (beta-lactamase class C family)
MADALADIFGRAGLSLIMRCAVIVALCASPVFSVARGESTPRPVAEDWQAGAEASANLSTLIAERYPSVQSIVVVRGNCLAWEYDRPPSNRETLHPLYSVTKSVLSVLIGIAIDRGYLRLTERLSELLPETRSANIDPRVGDITIRDLLTMTSGFDTASALPKEGIPIDRLWLWMIERPLVNDPGSRFAYDNTSANLLSVVLTKAIRQNPKVFAQKNLFAPLGIHRYAWTTDYEGNLIAGGTLSLTARDMAKIGLLYLRRGAWRDERIVSEAFVADSTAKHNDGGPPVNIGYGYLWWVEPDDASPRAFLAAGMGSQLISVSPERGLVVAMASESSVPGGSRSLLKTILAPAVLSLPSARGCAPL